MLAAAALILGATRTKTVARQLPSAALRTYRLRVIPVCGHHGGSDCDKATEVGAKGDCATVKATAALGARLDYGVRMTSLSYKTVTASGRTLVTLRVP